MPKKIRVLLVLAFALAALLLLPGVSFASSRSATTSATTQASFAFTGLVTGTKTAITGGLTIGIRSTGYFNGQLKLPAGTQIPVSGEIKRNGSLNIAFYDAKGHIIIRGQGTPWSNGEYVGPFQVFSGSKQIASGRWSAVPVAHPKDVLALAFTGEVVSGADKGLFLSGAIVLSAKTLSGGFNLPSGAVIPISASLSNGGKDINVTFNLGNGVTILGQGKLVENPANGLDKGFAGPFEGPASNDRGQWVAYFFKF